MIAMRFVDTNILLYAATKHPGHGAKAENARRILDADDLAMSVQVLQEFYVQATRQNRPDPMSHQQAAGLLESFCRFPVQETTLAIVRAALETTHRHQISYWDAAVIEAARALGCRTVLSEDLNHGQDFGGVRVENPFLERRPAL
jgi:predicted nucleic acid-binding protein